MTGPEAKVLVATLAAAWPRQEISQATLDVYSHDLVDLEFSVAEQAVEQIRRTATFFPAIAEIRNAAAEILLGAPSPIIGWKQASSRGAERHPLVGEARRIVGDDWTWRTESTGKLRGAFMAAYAEVRAEAIRSLAVGDLEAAPVQELTA